VSEVIKRTVTVRTAYCPQCATNTNQETVSVEFADGGTSQTTTCESCRTTLGAESTGAIR